MPRALLQLDTSAGAMRVAQAADFLGVSAAKVYELMAEGEVPFVLIGGRKVLLKPQLEAYLARKAAEQQDENGRQKVPYRGQGRRPAQTRPAAG